ncbi:MAG: Spy/CpxP family protein refolding chaperone [Acidobacteriia bacterium]|nr:Spy/CpxP family protein refolding chaperone [Terriglobia bacterium]
MQVKSLIAVLVVAFVAAAAASAQDESRSMKDCPLHAHHAAFKAEPPQQHPGHDDSPDPRPEYRAIKSLTAEEIKAYEEGIGHGMAKAAEQNHYPGPRHVLDLAKELQLSEEQARQIQQIKDAMSQAAISTGQQLIENERKLNALFAGNEIDDSQLAALTAESASLQGKLRLIHLSAHLKTQKLLSPAQIAKYDELRGYGNRDEEKSSDASHHHQHSH